MARAGGRTSPGRLGALLGAHAGSDDEDERRGVSLAGADQPAILSVIVLLTGRCMFVSHPSICHWHPLSAVCGRIRAGMFSREFFAADSTTGGRVRGAAWRAVFLHLTCTLCKC